MPGRTSDFRVEVPRLRSLRKDMRRLKRDIDKDLKKEIRSQMKPIVMDARGRYDKHYTRRSGRSRRSIRASVTKSKVVLYGDSRRTKAHMSGQEWGSIRSKQFGSRQAEGRFFWPAVRDGLKNMSKGIDAAVRRSSSRAGFS